MITKKGTVVKVSGLKTIKVEVNEYRTHPKYKKKYRVTKGFLVHDEDSVAKVGETVTIKQSSPVSKRKHWTLVTEKTAK